MPAAFPIEDILSPRDLRHVMRLYSIGGLSYGNLSARRDATRFWMSASGVDKSRLVEIGRDILLVTGYDPARQAMLLSVPPGIEPRRVSVDAIEHWMIYQAHPEVGAILHVHCWMEDIPATEINYPCGTEELAVAVSDLVATIDHNLASGPDAGRFQRRVAYDNLPAEAIAEIHARVRREGQALLERLDRVMARRDRDANPRAGGTGRKRAMVGVYFAVDDVPPEEGES
mgnify:CR=1 FL=1